MGAISGLWPIWCYTIILVVATDSALRNKPVFNSYHYPHFLSREYIWNFACLGTDDIFKQHHVTTYSVMPCYLTANFGLSITHMCQLGVINRQLVERHDILKIEKGMKNYNCYNKFAETRNICSVHSCHHQFCFCLIWWYMWYITWHSVFIIGVFIAY